MSFGTTAGHAMFTRRSSVSGGPRGKGSPLALHARLGQHPSMPCLVGCLAMLTPRIVIFLIWLFSGYMERAYDTKIWPLLGFLFMPLTTLAYAWSMNTYHEVRGLGLVVVVLAVLFDLGLIGGGGAASHKRYRERHE